MASVTEITEGAALQPFVLLAKGQKGKGCSAVLMQAISAPNVFVFGELLDLPSVQQLEQSDEKKVLDLVRIFAYGTYPQWKSNSAAFPELNPVQIRKLKLLTLVSLAERSRVIEYAVLQRDLDIKELRELEDLIIDAIYQGLIQGRLDQHSQKLVVEAAMGRDLKPDALEFAAGVLGKWSVQSDSLLASLKERIGHANKMMDFERERKEDLQKRIDEVKSTLKAIDFDTDDHDDKRRRGGRMAGGAGAKKGGRT